MVSRLEGALLLYYYSTSSVTTNYIFIVAIFIMRHFKTMYVRIVLYNAVGCFYHANVRTSELDFIHFTSFLHIILLYYIMFIMAASLACTSSRFPLRLEYLLLMSAAVWQFSFLLLLLLLAVVAAATAAAAFSIAIFTVLCMLRKSCATLSLAFFECHFDPYILRASLLVSLADQKPTDSRLRSFSKPLHNYFG